MSFFLVNLLLALLWAALQQFRPIDMITGFVLGFAIIALGQNWIGSGAPRYVRWMPVMIRFSLYYLGEVINSTLDVMRALFRDQSTLRPGIIAYPLDVRSEFEIVLFNILLTLTPGTTNVALSEDRTLFYIHIIDVRDPEEARQRIKTGLERRLLEVLR